MTLRPISPKTTCALVFTFALLPFAHARAQSFPTPPRAMPPAGGEVVEYEPIVGTSPLQRAPISLDHHNPYGHTAPPVVSEVLVDHAPVVIEQRGGSPRLVLTDTLIANVQSFLATFGPTAAWVPDGRLILRDAENLRFALYDYRNALLTRQPPHELRERARAVNRHGERFTERVSRIARGRIGPNIQMAFTIGSQTQQLVLAAGLKPHW